MKEIPDNAGAPFANCTPVKVAHHVVDVDVPKSVMPSSWRGCRRRWLGKTWPRFAKIVDPSRGARHRPNGGSPATVVGKTIERAENMGAERQKRMLEAQQFADGIETRIE